MRNKFVFLFNLVLVFQGFRIAVAVSLAKIQPTSTFKNIPESSQRSKRQASAAVAAADANISISSNATAVTQCGILQCCRQLTSCVPSGCGLDAQTCAVLEFNMLVGQLGQFRPGAIFPNSDLVPPLSGNATSGAVLYHLPSALRAEVLYTPRANALQGPPPVAGGLVPPAPQPHGLTVTRYAPFSSAYGTVVFDQTSTIVISDIPANRRIQTYVLQQVRPTPAQITFINYGGLTDVANRLSCGAFTVAAFSRTIISTAAPGAVTTLTRTVAQVIRPIVLNTVLPATCSALPPQQPQPLLPSVVGPTSALPIIAPTATLPLNAVAATAGVAGSTIQALSANLALPVATLLSSTTAADTPSGTLLTTTITVTVTPTISSSSPSSTNTTIPPGKVAKRITITA